MYSWIYIIFLKLRLSFIYCPCYVLFLKLNFKWKRAPYISLSALQEHSLTTKETERGKQREKERINSGIQLFLEGRRPGRCAMLRHRPQEQSRSRATPEKARSNCPLPSALAQLSSSLFFTIFFEETIFLKKFKFICFPMKTKTIAAGEGSENLSCISSGCSLTHFGAFEALKKGSLTAPGTLIYPGQGFWDE